MIYQQFLLGNDQHLKNLQYQVTYSRYSKIAAIRGDSVGGCPDDSGQNRPRSLKYGEAVQSSGLEKYCLHQLFGQQELTESPNSKPRFQLKSRLHSSLRCCYTSMKLSCLPDCLLSFTATTRNERQLKLLTTDDACDCRLNVATFCVVCFNKSCCYYYYTFMRMPPPPEEILEETKCCGCEVATCWLVMTIIMNY